MFLENMFQTRVCKKDKQFFKSAIPPFIDILREQRVDIFNNHNKIESMTRNHYGKNDHLPKQPQKARKKQ